MGRRAPAGDDAQHAPPQRARGQRPRDRSGPERGRDRVVEGAVERSCLDQRWTWAAAPPAGAARGGAVGAVGGGRDLLGALGQPPGRFLADVGGLPGEVRVGAPRLPRRRSFW